MKVDLLRRSVEQQSVLIECMLEHMVKKLIFKQNALDIEWFKYDEESVLKFRTGPKGKTAVADFYKSPQQFAIRY